MSLIANIARDDLFPTLATLQSVTGKKGTIAVLSNILVESAENKLIMTATDLETGIRMSIPAEILSPGIVTIPAKKFFEITRETKTDTIHFEEIENNWVSIEAGSAKYNVSGMGRDEYPSFPEYDEKRLFKVDCETLKELIDKTIFSVAQEKESQFNLTGVVVESERREEDNFLKMVTSDGHRLTLMEKEVEGNFEEIGRDKITLIPKKGNQEIRKFCDNYDSVEIGFEEKQCVVKGENGVIIIRLMNGDFPDYKSLLNNINKEKYIEINRDDLVASLKRITLFSEERYSPVQMKIENNNIILTSQNVDIGSAKDEIKTSYDDTPLILGFNGKYFIDVLGVMKSEIIKLHISSEESPCLISGDNDPGFSSIIMPMKL